MRAIKIIFRRELGAYLRSPFSWVLAALFLLLSGILFEAFGLAGKNLSAFVLESYFQYTSVLAIGGGLVLSFRLISEERQNHSMILLNTSPIRDSEIVIGKYFASLVYLAIMLAMSLYMPFLLKIGNKISTAQIFVGYFGMLLAGSAGLAIGMFGSALTRYQLVSIVIAIAIAAVMGNLSKLGQRLEGVPRDVFVDLDLWWTHYTTGFMRGILNLKDVIYYVAVTYFFLLLSVKTLEAKRWQ
jgi:gliding motility-associated transport system permease protein